MFVLSPKTKTARNAGTSKRLRSPDNGGTAKSTSTGGGGFTSKSMTSNSIRGANNKKSSAASTSNLHQYSTSQIEFDHSSIDNGGGGAGKVVITS
jgi:hypothetical protein